jgi:hypothetical protein
VPRHAVFCFDVGAPSEDLVDKVELAIFRRRLEGGPVMLRCGRQRGGG